MWRLSFQQQDNCLTSTLKLSRRPSWIGWLKRHVYLYLKLDLKHMVAPAHQRGIKTLIRAVRMNLPMAALSNELSTRLTFTPSWQLTAERRACVCVRVSAQATSNRGNSTDLHLRHGSPSTDIISSTCRHTQTQSHHVKTRMFCGPTRDARSTLSHSNRANLGNITLVNKATVSPNESSLWLGSAPRGSRLHSGRLTI